MQNKVDLQNKVDVLDVGFGTHGGVCAVCLDKIALQDTALVKGCEHAYWFVQLKSLVFMRFILKLLLRPSNSIYVNVWGAYDVSREV